MSLLILPAATATPDPSLTGATPTPSPTPAPTSADALSPIEGLVVAGLLMVGLLIIGIILLRNRRRSPQDSLVRSWLAISFAFGLLLFTAVALTLQDATLRSTLIGAVAASVGAAVSHYFASKANDEARRDVLAAAAGTETVPDLVGLPLAEINQKLSTTSLRLEQTALPQDPSHVVKTQSPAAGTVVPRGTAIDLTFGPA